MDSYTPRRCYLILVVLILSACVPTNANDPLRSQSKPSQVKVLISQVIEDESVNVRGDSQLELDVTPPEGATNSTFAIQATGEGTKQLSIAALDQGNICWVTFSFNTIMQLNGTVDAQSLALKFTLTETFEGKPPATSDCSIIPPIEGALLFVPFTEGPYKLSPENPVVKLSSAPNSWTEVRLDVGGD
ncbi:MAG: hypothetical protein WBB65_10415 [Anaerolineales bacterium]